VTCVATTSLVKGARASRSTIALKMMMAGSGLIFIGFVLLHMYGNLRAFWGHDDFDRYAEGLRTFGTPDLPYGGLLWIIRIVLIVSLVIHVWSAATLWRRAKRARTVKYQVKKNKASTTSSRMMRWGGVTILLFLIWHLLEFTIVKVSVNPDHQGANVTQDPYNLIVASFQVWWLTLIYLVAMAALAMHLHHGVWSASQTLGLTNSERSRVFTKRLGVLAAVVIAGGFSLVPIFVLVGVIS
jgi:succinate dehydrogenase / fumarate reductase cytochrome b subunit